MRKTKIVCTLGPATDNEDVLRKLMLAGMNVARLNFSHGTHEEQKGRMDMVKKLREELEKLGGEIERAERAERIRRERERNARTIVEENKKCCPVAIMPNGIICRNIHPSQCGLGIGEISGDTENKTLKIKQNSRLRSNDSRWGNRNLNQRKFKLSEPARRRK